MNGKLPRSGFALILSSIVPAVVNYAAVIPVVMTQHAAWPVEAVPCF